MLQKITFTPAKFGYQAIQKPNIPSNQLPVPVSHYGQMDIFVPKNRTLELILQSENITIPKKGIPNESLPVPMDIVEKARKQKSKNVKQEAKEVASMGAEAGKKAAKSSGKWGWIIGGIGTLSAIGLIVSDKVNHNKAKNLNKNQAA
ncbi:hypothetical protein J6E39_09930 [bacterium]|nr:hypothetical protein [bacterium]